MENPAIVNTYENHISEFDNKTFEELGIELDPVIKSRTDLYNEKYYNTTHYKWLNNNYTHFGHKYTPNSLNVDKLNFSPTKTCSPGGLYFTNAKNFLHWQNYGTHLHEVKIYSNTPVYSEDCGTKAKVPAFYLGREISQNSVEFFDMICNTKRHYQNNYMDKILDFSAKNEFNIIDKNLSVSEIIKLCITGDYYIKENHMDTIKKIKEKYIPEIKKKYVSKTTKNIQNSDKFEDFLSKNINDKIMEKLKDTGSFISGSSVLKFMLNENFVFDDIDIYCNVSNVDTILSCFVNEKYNFFVSCSTCKFRENKKTIKCETCNNYSLISRTYKENNLTINNADISDYNMTGILGILTIRKNSIKSQIIVLKDEIKPENFIRNNFDFDFCKCVYDGIKFRVLECENINQKVGKISDEYMTKCFTDKDSYSTYRISKTAERIVKYIKRGFDITNVDTFFDNILDSAK